MDNQQKAEYNLAAAKALGEELRSIRNRQGVEVVAVAERLKLSAEQIHALENGEYADFSGLVFVTGFLRAYARLLKMSDADISGRLKTVMPQAANHVYAVDRKQEQAFDYQSAEKAGFPKWILGVAALALIGGGVFAWQNKSNQENEQKNEQESSAVQSSLQAPDLKSSNVAVSKMTDEGTHEIAASQASDAAASTASELVVKVDADELWIKVQYRSNLIVKDKDGKMVFSRIIPAGSERRFKGGAPYDVWVGIAAGAQANYGGTAIKPESYRAAGEKSASFIAGKK